MPTSPELTLLPASQAVLGEGMAIRRALPTRLRRMVGPWCFLDHFGPADVAHGDGMRVGPHPHIGLQTVTWLHSGEILHRDSLGSLQTIRPGQLNVMTSGRGIAHSEESPQQRSAELHGLQFWIALPEQASAVDADFEHHAELPQRQQGGFALTLMVGEALGERSPARLHSPALGLDIVSAAAAATTLALRSDFEYAALVSAGEVSVAGQALRPGSLLYLGQGRQQLDLRCAAAARLTLIGGEPVATPVLMWWNFVARSPQALLDATLDWNAGRGAFGEVQGYRGERLPAPLPPWAGT